jgi:hypothetical protein
VVPSQICKITLQNNSASVYFHHLSANMYLQRLS